MTVLAVRSLTGWLKWWGVPITLTGGLGLILGLTAVPLTQFSLPLVAAQNTSAYALRLATTVMDVTSEIAWQVAIPVVIASVVLILIGTGMLLGAWLIGKKKAAEA
jgi:hypothetical protein